MQAQVQNTMLQIARKRALSRDDCPESCKRRRSRSVEIGVPKNVCFFCGKPPGTSGLHEAATFQVDERVRRCAMFLKDTKLLAKLSTADMVALEAKYHTKCLVGLYNHARKAKDEKFKDIDDRKVASGIASAELVMYIKETQQMDKERAPVFKLNDLAQLYMSE